MKTKSVREIQFDKMPSVYWSARAKIEYIQRHIIVYSILYYGGHESCVSDQYYDGISKQLVRLQKKYPDQFADSQYYYAMYDFDGTTGFDISDRLHKSDRVRLQRYAKHIYSLWKQEGSVLSK